MNHLHRFYAPTMAPESSEILLSDEESHHALRVARLHDGDQAAAFNGSGLEVWGTLHRTGKRGALIRAEQWRRHAPSRIALTLAVAGLQRDKPQEEVIRRATELGVGRVCFWRAERSQRPVIADSRWQKISIEACKQCGRAHLPVLDTAPSLERVLTAAEGAVLVALPENEATAPVRLGAASVTLLIGPEGDFSPTESALALDHGAQPVNLGPYVFRAEVAAIILATLAAGQGGQLGPSFALDVT